jgi:hypothetical protein
MSKGKRVFITGAVLAIVVIVVYGLRAPIESAMAQLSEAYEMNVAQFVLTIGGGIFASLIAAGVYSHRQREIWAADVGASQKKLEEIEGHLNQLRGEYHDAFAALPKALGGSFTSSVLSYHPQTSPRVAEILSASTLSAYEQHWSRVSVFSGDDVYRITNLRLLQLPNGGSTPVWDADFCVSWEWLNDSRVPKHPLDDFTLVIAAPQVAVDHFSYSSGLQRELQRQRYDEFLRSTRNPVRSVVSHPAGIALQIPQEFLEQVFYVKSIKVIMHEAETEVAKGELQVHEPGRRLPSGVYAAYHLPDRVRGQAFVLQRNERIRVEYRGYMALEAVRVGDPARAAESYHGFMGFAPSDIIGAAYDLSLVYPPELVFDGERYTMDYDNLTSGCQHLREPLKFSAARDQVGNHLPPDFRLKKGEAAALVRVTGEPLTHEHFLTMEWYGVRNVSAEAGSIPAGR